MPIFNNFILHKHLIHIFKVDIYVINFKAIR